MDRRGFLARATGFVAVVPALRCGSEAAPPADEFPAGTGGRGIDALGVQLYTVRSLMAEDAAGTLAAVAEIGYEEVELAGLYGAAPQEMRGLLDRMGLRAVSSHVGLGPIRSEPEAVLDEAAVLGVRYVTCPSIPGRERTAEGYRRVADDFNAFGERARSRGLAFAYHNHAFEFESVDGGRGYDILLDRCEAELVKMQMDVFWTVHGGADPIGYFRAHPGRFPLIHAKDRTASGDMVDVGRGVIDFAAILAEAETAGLEHVLVEHDRPEDPLRSIRASYETLAPLVRA